MRRRLPSPIRPFDLAPAGVVEAAKRIFAMVWPGPRHAPDPMARVHQAFGSVTSDDSGNGSAGPVARRCDHAAAPELL